MEKLCSLQDISPPTQVHKNTIKLKIVSPVNATSAIAKLDGTRQRRLWLSF